MANGLSDELPELEPKFPQQKEKTSVFGLPSGYVVKDGKVYNPLSDGSMRAVGPVCNGWPYERLPDGSLILLDRIG